MKRNDKCEPYSNTGLTGIQYQRVSTTVRRCLRLFQSNKLHEAAGRVNWSQVLSPASVWRYY